MAIVVYSNGITEEYRPNHLVFTEEELVFMFPGFLEIRTSRIPSLLNTWCIYGSGNDQPEDFNRVVSEITGDKVFCPGLFVHDSEIDPKWNLTDDVLYKGYEEFKISLQKLVDEMAVMIMKELTTSEEYEKKVDILPQLVPLGVTNDESKRILFAFNPEDQKEEFYHNEEFERFSTKVYSYLSVNKQTEDPFTIYADKKAIIIIESAKVNQFLDAIIKNFTILEEYEKCSALETMKKEWQLNHVKVKDSEK